MKCKKMSKILTAIVLSASMISLAACGPKSENAASNSASKNPTITVGVYSDIASFDPTWVATLTDRGMLCNIYDTLITYDSSSHTYKASLASKWSQKDNEITFKLKKGIKFSNGAELTANDVVVSLKRLYDDKVQSRMKSQATFIKDVIAVDNSTVKVVCKQPTANALSYISTFMIVQADSIAKFDSHELDAPYGTGPFELTEWKKQQSITLSKNKNYWGKKVAINKLIFKVIPTLSTRIDELKTGSIDVATQITPDMLSSVKNIPNVSIMSSTGTTLFLGANVFSGPLKDVRVRQALTMAIDGNTIAKKLYNGTASVLNQQVTKQSFGYSKEVSNFEYNPKKAKELLTEAGYPNGFTIDYDGPQGYYTLDKDLISTISQQLSDNLGVKLNVTMTDYATYWDKFLAKKCQGIYLAGITNPIQDADFVLNLHVYSPGRGIYYNTKKTDDLITQAKHEMDPKARQKLYDEIMTTLHADNPWILTLGLNDSYAVSSRIKGFKPGDYTRLYFGNASIK
mgnify:CR=1 FL=1